VDAFFSKIDEFQKPPTSEMARASIVLPFPAGTFQGAEIGSPRTYQDARYTIGRYR